jgi:hypothetical protein
MNSYPLWTWAPRVYALMAAVLVPWTVYLALTLPDRATESHYEVAWAGFDALLVALLARTAYLAWRHHPQAMLSAAAVSTMLIVDAWFDIVTAPTRGALALAIALAVLFELPGAFLSMALARRAQAAWIAGLFASDPPPSSDRSETPHG